MKELMVTENHMIEVFENSSGEIFVRLCNHPEVQLRISDEVDSFVVTAHGCLMTPTSVNGLGAFKVFSK